MIFRCIAARDRQFAKAPNNNKDAPGNSKESLGALGYEPKKIRKFHNLQDAGGSQNPCKERSVSFIGQLMDRRTFWKVFKTGVEVPNEFWLVAIIGDNILKATAIARRSQRNMTPVISPKNSESTRRLASGGVAPHCVALILLGSGMPRFAVTAGTIR